MEKTMIEVSLVNDGFPPLRSYIDTADIVAVTEIPADMPASFRKEAGIPADCNTSIMLRGTPNPTFLYNTYDDMKEMIDEA